MFVRVQAVKNVVYHVCVCSHACTVYKYARMAEHVCAAYEMCINKYI